MSGVWRGLRLGLERRVKAIGDQFLGAQLTKS